jgi:hypothetical protein
MTVFRKSYWGLLAIVFLSLSGCLGGSVAQQLASSFAMHAADKIAAGAIDQYELNQEVARRNVVLQNRAPDEYWAAFITSGFSPVTPTVQPLPQNTVPQQDGSPASEVTPLVRVEVWNMLIGDEKIAVLEKARLLGANLPPERDWPNWQIAAGALASEPDKPVLFLIPPKFGRIASGELAIVEMAGPGELNYARYALN